MKDYKLRSRKDFDDTMVTLRQLKRIDENQRVELLRELYDLAADRERIEREVQNEKELFSEVRVNRKRRMATIRLLKTAYHALLKARDSNLDLLLHCEQMAPKLYEKMVFTPDCVKRARRSGSPTKP